MRRIDSKDNQLVKLARELGASRDAREAEGLFVCEGHRLCFDALQSGAACRTLLVCERSDAAYGETMSLANRTGCEIVLVAKPAFEKITNVETSQGVVLICETPDDILPPVFGGERYLLLDRVSDPGNVGTIIRTADAFGADGVMLLEGCADLYSPKTVRATMGSLFHIKAWKCDADAAISLCKKSGLTLYASAISENAADVREIKKHSGVIIGNEAAGVSEKLQNACDNRVYIPMRGGAQSLNAAAAAAVILWEMQR